MNCTEGVYDCDFDDSGFCAPYNDKYENPEDLSWVVALASIFAALMSFGLGANDAANSWGTAIGSKAVSLRTGLLVGGLAEWLGAVCLGYGVSSTIQSGVSDYEDSECWACGYCDSKMTLYTIAMFCSLISASLFLLLATFTSMPVSTTHAIIGAVVGATVVGVGFDCLSWDFDGGLGGIMASWVISPLLSGFLASSAFIITRSYIFKSQNPLERALIAVPIFFGLTTFIMVFLVFLKSPPTKKLDLWIMFVVSFFCSIIMYGVVYKFLIPRIRRKVPSQTSSIQLENRPPSIVDNMENQLYNLDEEDTKSVSPSVAPSTAPSSAPLNPGSKSEEKSNIEEEDDVTIPIADALYCFRPLLIFQALLESFAHGANDTANATAAFSSVLSVYSNGLTNCDSPESPAWVLLIAGFFVFLGVNTFGSRVVKTIGSSLTKLNFHRAYCIEFGSTLSVVVATLLNMPVSTTHCQVGAVILVGAVEFGLDKVEWGMFGRIVLTWIISVPFSALICAALVAIFDPIVTN